MKLEANIVPDFNAVETAPDGSYISQPRWLPMPNWLAAIWYDQNANRRRCERVHKRRRKAHGKGKT